MEKSTPHCRLPVVKAMIEAGKVRSTMSALAGGAAAWITVLDLSIVLWLAAIIFLASMIGRLIAQKHDEK